MGDGLRFCRVLWGTNSWSSASDSIDNVGRRLAETSKTNDASGWEGFQSKIVDMNLVACPERNERKT